MPQDLADALVANLDGEDVPVVIIRANDIAFMGLMRGIASVGLPCISCFYDWEGASRWYSEASKHFQNVFRIHNPAENELCALEDFILLGKAIWNRYQKKALVLPSSDTVQLLFFRHETELSRYFNLMGAPDFNSFRQEVTHKGTFFERLQIQNRDLSPQTFHCDDVSQIDEILEKASYPAIVKPAIKDFTQSFYRLNNGSKALLCDDTRHLRSTLISLLDHKFDLVVQQRIKFDSAKDEIPFYAYADRNHKIRVASTAIKEFIQPAPYGTATILRLTWHPELLALAQEIISAVKWTGTFMIEFVRDKDTNRWQVVEVNTRPWLFHDFFRQQGLPFVPYSILDHAEKLNDMPDLIVPGKKLLNTRPVHLDIKTIASEICSDENTAPKNLKILLSLIERYSDNYSLAHGTENDPGPAMQLFEDLDHELNFSKENLINIFLKPAPQ